MHLSFSSKMAVVMITLRKVISSGTKAYTDLDSLELVAAFCGSGLAISLLAAACGFDLSGGLF